MKHHTRVLFDNCLCYMIACVVMRDMMPDLPWHYAFPVGALILVLFLVGSVPRRVVSLPVLHCLLRTMMDTRHSRATPLFANATAVVYALKTEHQLFWGMDAFEERQLLEDVELWLAKERIPYAPSS